MSPVLLILVVAGLLIIALALLIVLNGLRTRGSIERSLDLVLLSFALPRTTQQDSKQDKELIALMEQFYASLATMHVKGWNKFVFGDPYIALEIAVHNIGEQIVFYASVPSKFVDNFEKQVHGIFPSANVERSQDYNIFHPAGASAGAVMKLTADPIIPISTYADLPTDPLGPLVGALSRLDTHTEGAVIQVLVRHTTDDKVRRLAQDTARYMQAGNDLQKAIKMAKHPSKSADPKRDDPALSAVPKVSTEFEAKVIRSLQAKASRPLFACNVRILASAATQVRADQILGDLTSAFSQFSSPNGNAFSAAKLTGKALERLAYEFAFRLFNTNQSVLLSSEELSSVYHFPVSSALLPKVKFTSFKTAEPPPGLPQTGLAIGENIYHGQSTLLRLGKEDRRRHMYIIGQTGTGKSVTMQSMIVQDMQAGEGITVIDPHGSLADWTLKNVPKDRIDDVIYFNPADTEHPMALNMLEYDLAHPHDKTLIIDELFEIMEKLYDMKTSGGPMFERYFKNALFLLLDNASWRVPTLADVSRVFVDDSFRDQLLEREPNPTVKQFWLLEATKATGDQSLANFAPYISSKVDSFTTNDFLRPIINQTRSAINMSDVIEQKKILVINLNKGKIGDMNANLLGMVLVGKLRRAALARDTSRPDMPDHYCYMDEFQNISTNSISVILAEARKYRLCLVMAHQFIKQLDDRTRDAVFGNVGTMVVARVSPEDADASVVKTKFEPVFSSSDIANIDNLNAYVTMLVNGQVSRPCSMRMLTDMVFGKGDAKVRDAIIEICRLRYTSDLASVEAEIRGRFQPTS